jgi:hypothetical protein
VAAVFLSSEGLPFSDVLSATRIERAFARHGNLFGVGTIYSTSVIVWAFLGQVLSDGKQAACQSAVSHIVSWCLLSGRVAPTQDTGDYCRARAKLCERALHELSCEVAAEVEQAADAKWMWQGLHAKLVDGFTFTMPDTEANQEVYPQQKAQAPGVGFPIARAVAVLSLATACVLDLACGPYKGKQTGESALLRSLLPHFGPGDVAVMDRYYCSYMMMAHLIANGAHVCVRKDKRRHTNFRKGRRLGKYDHIVVWTRPIRPPWMDEATYASIPLTLELRELSFRVVEPGRRTHKLTIITTMTDREEFAKEAIAQLYAFRWNAELDIRSIKCALNLDHVRCKSPEMVRRELWTTLLAYNLIRTTAAAAAALHDKHPRQISFTSTCQHVLAGWITLPLLEMTPSAFAAYCRELLARLAQCEVGHRPGRLEPRRLKRRRHRYGLLHKARSAHQADLHKLCT